MFLLKNTQLQQCYNVTPPTEQQGSRMDQSPGAAEDLSCGKCKAFYEAYITMDGE